MNRFTLEHWRDGDLIESFDIRNRIRCKGNVATIVFPEHVELAIQDEMRFDRNGLIEVLCQLNTSER